MKRPGQPQAPTKRCAIYTRKSTAKGLEQDFNSLDAQQEACEHYVRARAYEGWAALPEVYSDGGYTGANTARPGFQQLLADIEAGKLDIIVVYKVDRLSRSLLDFAKLMERFSAAGVEFVSVTQNFSTADAMGRLTLNLLMSFAEFEHEMISERTRDKISASRRRGKWTGGHPPLGYDVVDKRLVVNDFEAMVVREVFALYEKQRSILAVARTLNERGRITKLRAASTGRRSGGRPWTKAEVVRTLRQVLYTGRVSTGGELYDGEHDEIVDRATFERVQRMLGAHPKRPRQHYRNPEYLLAGLLRCGCCGGALTPASTVKRSGQRYRYYRCVARDKKGREACPAKQLSAPALEGFVVERIRDVTADGKLAAAVRERLAGKLERERTLLEAERRRLPAEVARASSSAHELLDQVGKLTGRARALADQRLQAHGDQLAALEQRLDEVERRLAELEAAEADVGWVADALQDFDRVWDVMTTENRKRLVTALVDHVEVNEPKGTISAALVDLGLADPFTPEEAAA